MMNISFSVLSPPTIGQASHTPSFFPDAVSQSLLVTQEAGGFILPATHAQGCAVVAGGQWIGEFGGMCDARVTSVGSGDEPSPATPLLYSAQKRSLSPALKASGGSKCLSGGSL